MEDDNQFGNTENEGAPEAGMEDIFPTVTFSTFLLSLSTSALVTLGELPDPMGNDKSVNLPLAKQTIHIIEMLKEKTVNNLGPEEGRLIDGILYDLRKKYEKAAG